MKKEGISRRSFLGGLAAAGLTAAGAGLLGVPRAAMAMAPGARYAGVVKVRGEAFLDGVRAKPGDSVAPGMTVETRAASSIVFTIGRDAFLLRERSRAVIAGARAENRVESVDLPEGRLLMVFGRGGVRRVSTPTAVAAIRGTGIYVEAEPGRSYVCTCYGTVEISAIAFPGASETVRTRHHEAPRYIYGPGAPEPIAKAPMQNHTDRELVMLEGLVGRSPDFPEDAGTY
jgi:hypothetical protein